MATSARNSRDRSRSGVAFAFAFAIHILAVIAVPEFRETVVEIVAPTSQAFVEVEPEPAVEPVEPPPPEPEPAERAPAPRQAATERAPNEAPAPPQQTTTVPQPEVITNLDDTNLGNFTVQQGTGAATQPIRSGVLGTTNTDGAANGVRDGGVTNGTGIVPDSDLSVRASSPPNLDELLNRFYPADARQQAVEGRAVVAIEVRSDGSIGRVRKLRESVADFGFAQACIRMVRESGRWTPGRDRDGNTVSSVLPFSCDFSVRR